MRSNVLSHHARRRRGRLHDHAGLNVPVIGQPSVAQARHRILHATTLVERRPVRPVSLTSNLAANGRNNPGPGSRFVAPGLAPGASSVAPPHRQPRTATRESVRSATACHAFNSRGAGCTNPCAEVPSACLDLRDWREVGREVRRRARQMLWAAQRDQMYVPSAVQRMQRQAGQYSALSPLHVGIRHVPPRVVHARFGIKRMRLFPERKHNCAVTDAP